MVGVKLWVGMMVLSLLALLFGACTSTGAPVPAPSPGSGPVPNPVVQESQEPLLSDVLMRNCERTRTSGGFGNVGLSEGQMAVNFTLKDIDGNVFSLSELLSEKPVVIEKIADTDKTKN